MVTFLFRKDFEESVWCEVLPIKVSHILLGRPWLFDRRVQHDGYENTCTLILDGSKKILHPIKEIPLVEQLEEKLVHAKLEEPKEVAEALKDLTLDFPKQNVIMSNDKLEEPTKIIEHYKFKNLVLPQDNLQKAYEKQLYAHLLKTHNYFENYPLVL